MSSSGKHIPCLEIHVNDKILSALCLLGVCPEESLARRFNLVPVYDHVGPHINKRPWWHFWSPWILSIQDLGLQQLVASDFLYGNWRHSLTKLELPGAKRVVEKNVMGSHSLFLLSHHLVPFLDLV